MRNPGASTMRNPDARHLDFSDLQGVIPSNPKWLPSNLDMVAERNGYFLVCEWKKPYEKFGGGQKILLSRLSITPKITVLIVEGGTDNRGMWVNYFWKLNDKTMTPLGTGIENFKVYINKWYGECDGRQS